MVRFVVYKSSSGHCACKNADHKKEHKAAEEESPRRDTVRLMAIDASGQLTASGAIELSGPPASLSGFIDGSVLELVGR